MKIIVALIFGLLSGFLIYMGAAMLFVSGEPSGAFVFITFLGGWAISSWIIVRKTKTLSRVFSRGFLLGAAEWMAMIPIGLVFGGRVFSQTVAQVGDTSNAATAGVAIGAGLFSMITGSVAIVMAVVCLIGFAISYFMGREMRAETSPAKVPCPECAELIQADARKCRFCGAQIGG